MAIKIGSDLFERLRHRGVSEVVSGIFARESIELVDKYGARNYHPLPVNVARAEGSRVWDSDGNEFIDCIGAYSAVSHGHLNRFIVETAEEQLRKLSLTSRALHSSELGLFLEALCLYTDLDKACPINSGAEAIETCIKLARKWGYSIKGIPAEKAEIIVASGNFHGRTTTIVGFSSEEAYKDQFGPFTPGFKLIDFDNLKALDAAITDQTCAVLLEPIQAEGGVIIPHSGYLAGVREICTRHKVLLIWDEIQTGFGRTGKRFAWQWEDAKPDLMAVGKALGGGIYPVSAAVGSNEVLELFKPGDHGSTFGGNPLACAIGLAALAEMVTENYADLAESKGKYLRAGFSSLDSGKIKEVRGKGLLIGLEVNSDVDGSDLTRRFIGEGLLTKETRHNTFRFAPPLTIEMELLESVVEKVGRALRDC